MSVETVAKPISCFAELVRGRASVRKFKPDPVPDAVLREILDLGRLAPSEWNLQPWRFIVVREEANRRALAEACPGQSWVGDAPVILIACGDPLACQQAPERLREMIVAGKSEASREAEHLALIQSSYASAEVAQQFAINNTFIAVQQIALVALAYGVSSCWVGGFDEGGLKQRFRIPESCVVAALLPMGYPAEAVTPAPKLELDRICFAERYGARFGG